MGSLASLSFTGEGTFQEMTGAGFGGGTGHLRCPPDSTPRAEDSRLPYDPPTRACPAPPSSKPRRAPLTSSAWPSSKSKVTTHTHSSQAEKRVQGAAKACVPEDDTPRRPRAGRGPARDRASMAGAGTAGRALPGKRPGGVAGETARRRRPRRSSGPRPGAVERRSRARGARCPEAGLPAEPCVTGEVGSRGGRGPRAPRRLTRGRAATRLIGAECGAEAGGRLARPDFITEFLRY